MTLVYTNVRLEDLKQLEHNGYHKVETTNMYELIRLKNDTTSIILYSSGKLVIQTSKENEPILDKLFSKHFERESFPHKEEFALKQNVIGSDEALKGDTFGGIVVASFYCAEEDISKLKEIGVKDSKDLSKEQIISLAEKLKQEFPNNFVIQELTPTDYNDLLSIETITKVLNDLHALVGLLLKRNFKGILHIVDEYPGCNVGDIRITQAESKYLAVAAASILAKSKGIEQLTKLSKKAKFELPFGSTHVLLALERLKGKNVNPREFCKLEFKNVQKVFNK